MWIYEKKLEYPVRIKTCDPRMAKYVITQYGGPDGELGASVRYLSQRFSMPTEVAKAILYFGIYVCIPIKNIIKGLIKYIPDYINIFNLLTIIIKEGISLNPINYFFQ